MSLPLRLLTVGLRLGTRFAVIPAFSLRDMYMHMQQVHAINPGRPGAGGEETLVETDVYIHLADTYSVHRQHHFFGTKQF